jgi:hypothetical protein
MLFTEHYSQGGLTWTKTIFTGVGVGSSVGVLLGYFTREKVEEVDTEMSVAASQDMVMIMEKLDRLEMSFNKLKKDQAAILAVISEKGCAGELGGKQNGVTFD